MKLNIYSHDNGFYIAFEKYQRDSVIAKTLSLSEIKYTKILLDNRAYQPFLVTDSYFKNISDAEKTIEALEPYLIMKLLTN